MADMPRGGQYLSCDIANHVHHEDCYTSQEKVIEIMAMFESISDTYARTIHQNTIDVFARALRSSAMQHFTIATGVVQSLRRFCTSDAEVVWVDAQLATLNDWKASRLDDHAHDTQQRSGLCHNLAVLTPADHANATMEVREAKEIVHLLHIECIKIFVKTDFDHIVQCGGLCSICRALLNVGDAHYPMVYEAVRVIGAKLMEISQSDDPDGPDDALFADKFLETLSEIWQKARGIRCEAAVSDNKRSETPEDFLHLELTRGLELSAARKASKEENERKRQIIRSEMRGGTASGPYHVHLDQFGDIQAMNIDYDDDDDDDDDDDNSSYDEGLEQKPGHDGDDGLTLHEAEDAHHSKPRAAALRRSHCGVNIANDPELSGHLNCRNATSDHTHQDVCYSLYARLTKLRNALDAARDVYGFDPTSVVPRLLQREVRSILEAYHEEFGNSSNDLQRNFGSTECSILLQEIESGLADSQPAHVREFDQRREPFPEDGEDTDETLSFLVQTHKDSQESKLGIIKERILNFSSSIFCLMSQDCHPCWTSEDPSPCPLCVVMLGEIDAAHEKTFHCIDDLSASLPFEEYEDGERLRKILQTIWQDFRRYYWEDLKEYELDDGPCGRDPSTPAHWEGDPDLNLHPDIEDPDYLSDYDSDGVTCTSDEEDSEYDPFDDEEIPQEASELEMVLALAMKPWTSDEESQTAEMSRTAFVDEMDIDE